MNRRVRVGGECILSVQPYPSKMSLKGRKRLLIAISVASVLVVASAVAIFLRFPFFEPSISLEGKVELFVVHYENDANITVYPSTSEGGKLLSACEDVLNNLKGHLPLVIDDERITIIKSSSQYVEVILNDEYDFTIYSHLSGKTETTASRILFILSGELQGVVNLDGTLLPGTEEVVWGANWKIDVSSQYFQKLVDVVNQLKE